MCDCVFPTTQKSTEKIPDTVKQAVPKKFIPKAPKNSTLPVRKRVETKLIPCISKSRESWKSWREKLEWRKSHKYNPLKLDKVNGFYGDQQYHDATW